MKRRQKIKKLENFFWKNCERVFNMVRFIDKKHIRSNSPRDYKTSENKVEWIVVGKIVGLSLNYCLIKILENLSNYCGLQAGTEWNTEKAARKNSNKF